jgi:hypothetical protein
VIVQTTTRRSNMASKSMVKRLTPAAVDREVALAEHCDDVRETRNECGLDATIALIVASARSAGSPTAMTPAECTAAGFGGRERVDCLGGAVDDVETLEDQFERDEAEILELPVEDLADEGGEAA